MYLVQKKCLSFVFLREKYRIKILIQVFDAGWSSF